MLNPLIRTPSFLSILGSLSCAWKSSLLEPALETAQSHVAVLMTTVLTVVARIAVMMCEPYFLKAAGQPSNLAAVNRS